MPDYKNGKVYKIVCNETNEVYYGSTTEKYLSTRISGHRKSLKQYLEGDPNCKNKYSSFDIIQRNNYTYSLVELVPCDSKDELLARERHYIQNNDCVNKYVPGRTGKEHYYDTIEHQRERSKNYREDNKEKEAERHKKYRENNKDKVAESRKKYHNAKNDAYLAKKEREAQRDKSKVICPCCITELTFGQFRNGHQKSKKHLANLALTQSGMNY